MIGPMRILLAAVLLLAACDKGSSAKQEAAAELEAAEQKVGSVTPDELASLLDGKKAQAIDANNDATRSREGVVPGATLLSNYREYDLSVLPSDKAMKLVFYCANEQCGASHKAAARAVLAGWSDVAVMPAGIAGWKSAGKKTEPQS
jgi:rhodanese-related sulfurtransferase